MFRCFVFFVLLLSWNVHPLLADEATVTSEDEQPDMTVQSMENAEVEKPNGSPNVQALVALTSPPYGRYTEKWDITLPTGKRSSLVASMINTHEGTTLPRFTLDLIEGALHYPGYYEHIIQNFTKIRLQNTLEPNQEGSVSYSFTPAMELSGRSFDLSITVYYHDENDVYYSHSIFNQTVNLHEIDEGVDTEMLFLVTLVVASSVVILIGLWHWLGPRNTGRRTAVTATTQHHSNKFDSGDGENVVENEYLELLEGKKFTKLERSARQLTRRHGKR